MPNPIDQAKNLLSQLSRVLDEIPMVAKRKEEIESMHKQTATMIAALNYIHTEIVPLDLRDAAKQHAQNFEFYKSLPGGLIQKGEPAYERLFTQSATLNELYRAGVEMPSMMKFSDEELAFAKELGEGFQEWNEPLHDIMVCLQRREDYRETNGRYLQEWNRFLNLLKRWAVITDYQGAFLHFKRKEFVPAPMSKILTINPDNVFRFEWQKGKTEFDSLISGHWFSAFAYSIIVDHLGRLGSDFELYTLVRYSAPKDVIRSSGDLDVVVRAGGKILMIECKSGTLKRVGNRDDFADIEDKAKALERVFVHANSEIDDYTFWLVYNPYLNNPSEVSNELRESGIVSVKPEDIRGEVRRCFEARSTAGE
jgi:hypothetical protein